MLKGILFDFDGVLGQTLEDHFMAWKEAAADFGVKIGPEHYFPIEGMSVIELAKMYCGLGGIDEKRFAEKIVERKEKYYLRDLNFKFYPGVEEFIGILHAKKVPIAIVTAGLPERISKSAPADFLKKFTAIITSDKYDRGKPFPDPYSKGIGELNLQPSECVVIENAPFGVQSAKVAGTYCIGVCSTVSKELLKEADEIVEKFSDLKELNTIQKILEFNST